MTAPVGAVVNDGGLVFALTPEDLTTHPVRVQCTACPWEATFPTRDVADALQAHALHHAGDRSTPITDRPAWLTPRRKGTR